MSSNPAENTEEYHALLAACKELDAFFAGDRKAKTHKSAIEELGLK
ncbi:MAG: hypothetical protein Q4P78_06855 [Rothia sp. (in: high G+C Gram-positive bacteria)]|nr:hypothetical protein [Rothia sp. (in: high G+C Gram-positive bacteria)]MDO5750905.1 hypothetical protein [Rothia sp. (in: high G+C Gram-positive bacteria)]